MRLKVFEGEAQIGEAFVFALDPPMCVATAKFEATPAYDAVRHANVVGGDYVGDRTEMLRIEMSNGTALKSEAISIQDFSEIDEWQIDIIGIFEPSFESLFSDHPDFKDYWDVD